MDEVGDNTMSVENIMKELDEQHEKSEEMPLAWTENVDKEKPKPSRRPRQSVSQYAEALLVKRGVKGHMSVEQALITLGCSEEAIREAEAAGLCDWEVLGQVSGMEDLKVLVDDEDLQVHLELLATGVRSR